MPVTRDRGAGGAARARLRRARSGPRGGEVVLRRDGADAGVAMWRRAPISSRRSRASSASTASPARSRPARCRRSHRDIWFEREEALRDMLVGAGLTEASPIPSPAARDGEAAAGEAGAAGARCWRRRCRRWRRCRSLARTAARRDASAERRELEAVAERIAGDHTDAIRRAPTWRRCA